MATTDSEEMDFLIAADLTLYQNPLNSALNSYSPKPKASTSPSTLKKVVSDPGTGMGKMTSDAVTEAADTDEWIASDMTKYDSPLAELEKQHGKKMENIREDQRVVLDQSPGTK